MPPLTHHKIALKETAFATTFQKGTVANPIATAFGKVCDKILGNAPVIAADNINQCNRFGSFPRGFIIKSVSRYEDIVRRYLFLRIAFNGGMKANNVIAA